MPAALQATGPRKPRSVGSGEKSPSNSSPWASADSVAAESGWICRCVGAAHVLPPISESNSGKKELRRSSLRVIPRSALPYERYDEGTNRVNDRRARSGRQTEVSRRPRQCHEMAAEPIISLKLSLSVASD